MDPAITYPFEAEDLVSACLVLKSGIAWTVARHRNGLDYIRALEVILEWPHEKASVYATSIRKSGGVDMIDTVIMTAKCSHADQAMAALVRILGKP